MHAETLLEKEPAGIHAVSAGMNVRLHGYSYGLRAKKPDQETLRVPDKEIDVSCQI